MARIPEGNASTGERYGKQKVVYHINHDDPNAQAGALSNIQNHINAVGKENLDLKVVLNGKGISLLIKPNALKNTPGNGTDEIPAEISGLKEQGVAFLVCANTLHANKMNYENDLYDVNQADIVPSGVAELARLQGMGYAYIKP